MFQLQAKNFRRVDFGGTMLKEFTQVDSHKSSQKNEVVLMLNITYLHYTYFWLT